ncbi:MAG: formylmethanofuran--tetrahydromethanopterin N-formyltransferase [Nitrososphaerota archaeon]|nr:formylmethanofuran--tetrahydromethanopterin N-formyltransferase [Candidatus Bathyarchaeota archaeon]MDW8023904.1 formylmethanofuran--tetrahydromethanopterin N-formyltransferase [Nitrososphaerota archaeon]
MTSPSGQTVKIADTFAEMFPLWVGRVLITADNEKWALKAAEVTTGFATSVIMAPAEAGVEGIVPEDKTPDGRVGALVHIYNRNRFELKNQMLVRIGQCIMTCPTTAAFDGLPNAKRRLKIGRSLRYFGDGFQRKGLVSNRRVWRIPVMEGEFIVEDTFGVAEAVAGGNFLILARDRVSGLTASEEAVKAIASSGAKVIMPFPGGICRSGSKAGSLKYKLKASTNHPFCPSLKKIVADTQLPEEVNCVYEIVINGLTLEDVKKAMREGIKAASNVPGVVRITAGNYGGKLGPYKAFLKEVLETT